MNNQIPRRRPKPRRVAESERRRAVKACDGCRRQKEKCEGGIPCHRCIRLSRQCEFHSVRESLSTSDYKSAPQNDVNLTEILERSRYMEELLSYHVPGIKLDIDSLRHQVESVTADKAFVSEAAEPTGPNSMFDQASSDEEGSLKLDENFTVQPLAHNATHYSGEFSYWNFSMRIKKWIEDWGSQGNAGEKGESTSFKEFYRAENLESPSSEILASISYLPPRHIAEFLVAMFFKHAETNYFYVDRTWLQTVMTTAYESPQDFTSKDAGKVCSILAILAIGTQYAYLDSDSSKGGHQTRNLQETPTFSEDEIGRKFFQQASKLVSDVILIASFESVQACLLLGLYTLPLDASGLSYIYLNIAIKLGIQNGMHRKQIRSQFDVVTAELRNRVWWTIITIERRVCIMHGRPMSIPTSDVDAAEPVQAPTLTTTSSLSSKESNILISIKVTNFLAELAHQVIVLRHSPKSVQQENLRKLAHMKAKLGEWWSSLQVQPSLQKAASRDDLFRPNMHLKLEYCLCRMYVGRPFMFSRDSGTSPASRIDMLDRRSTRISTRAALVHDCVQAAREVVNICCSLRDNVGLARASYTEYSSCRAALLVLMAQSLHQRTDDIKNTLHTGMSLIRVMSAGGDSARSEVSLIEAFERAISRMDSLSENADPGTTASEDSAYDRFKNWEQLWKIGPTPFEKSNQFSALSPPTPNIPLSRTDFDFGESRAALFGSDDFSLSFPQVLEDFSTIPTFDYGFDGVPLENRNLDNDLLRLDFFVGKGIKSGDALFRRNYSFSFVPTAVPVPIG